MDYLNENSDKQLLMLHISLFMYALNSKLPGDKMTFDIILYVAIEMSEAMFRGKGKKKGKLNVELIYESILRDFFQDDRPDKGMITHKDKYIELVKLCK